MSTFPTKLPTIKSEKTVYEGFFSIKKEELDLSDGTTYTYETLQLAPFAVMVLARTNENLLVINREYRHPTRSFLLSCPGGMIDPGESFIETAMREFKEETGFEAVHFEILGEAFPFPGITPQKTLYVRAFHAHRTTDPLPEPTEFIETILISVEELKKKIQKGEAADGLLLSALYLDSIMSSSHHF